MRLVAAAAFSFLMLGCKNTHVRELREHLQSPDYTQSFETQSHRIEVRYLPRVLQALNSCRLHDSVLVTRKLADSLNGFGRKEIVFALRLSPKDSSDRNDLRKDVVYGKIGEFENYQKAFEEYQFGLAQKIWMESGGVRIPLGQYHMENSFGMTQGRTFILVFPEPHGFIANGTQASLVLEDIVPGLSRRKIHWGFPVGKYDENI